MELHQFGKTNFTFVKGSNMKVLPTLKNALALINNNIVEYGRIDDCPDYEVDENIDATGKSLITAWCDSHTQRVFSVDDSQKQGQIEFFSRILYF